MVAANTEAFKSRDQNGKVEIISSKNWRTPSRIAWLSVMDVPIV